MSKISKNKPGKEVEDLMWSRLVEVFREAKTDEAVVRILDDLLTPSEKIIFSKRLLIVLFLSKGLSYQQISKFLKVSSATINHVQNSKRRKGEGFSTLIEAMDEKDKSKLDKLLENIFEKIGSEMSRLERIYEARPRKSGPRWKWVNKM